MKAANHFFKVLFFLFTGNFCLLTFAFSQRPEWVLNIDKDSAQVISSCGMVADAAGNTYIAGEITDTSDFDPGTAVYNLWAKGSDGSSLYPRDIFVASYSNTGAFRWAFNIGGIAEESAFDIALDHQNNILVSGVCYVLFDADPGPAVHNIGANNGNFSFFVVKYDTAGNYVSTIEMRTVNSINRIEKIEVDGNGNLIIGGVFGGSADFDPYSTHTVVAPNALESGFLAKYDSANHYQWAFAFGHYPGNSEIASITTDAAGNIYVAGTTMDSADLDRGTGVFYLNQGRFIAKYDTGGALIWAHNTWTAANYSRGFTPTGILSHTASYFYVTGFTNGDSVDVDLGPDSLFYHTYSHRILVKYDTSGSFIWARDIGGGTPACCGITNVNPTLYTDDSAHIYVAGSFFDVEDFAPGAAVNNLGVSQDFSGFVVQFDSAGNYITAFMTGSNCRAVRVLSDFTMFTEGEFYGTCDFAPGPDTFLVSNGFVDTYIAKYGNGRTTSVNTMYSAEWQVGVYPNPAGNVLQLTSTEVMDEVSIITLQGEVLKTIAARQQYMFDLSDIPNGMFLLQCKNREQMLVKKIVISR